MGGDRINGRFDGKIRPRPSTARGRFGRNFFFSGLTGPFIYTLGWSDQFRLREKKASGQNAVFAEINTNTNIPATRGGATRSEAKGELDYGGTQADVSHTGVKHMRGASMWRATEARGQGHGARRGLARSGATQKATDDLSAVREG